MLPMRDDKQTVKIELFSQWMLEAEFRKHKFLSEIIKLGQRLDSLKEILPRDKYMQRHVSKDLLASAV